MTQGLNRSVLFVGMLSIVGLGHAADSCQQLRAQLVFNGNGTVSDKTTGLTWMRCSLGQEWTGSSCAGNTAKLSLDETTETIKTTGLADQGYRLPKLTELMSIVAIDCGEPAVVEEWKSIESGFYWTATEAFGGFQNTVLMTTGDEYPMSAEIGARVILVK